MKQFGYLMVIVLVLPCVGNGDWFIETVDSLATTYSGFPSLALDNSEYANVTYYNHTDDDLYYAAYDGIQWNILVVDSVGNVGWYCSLELKDDFYPCISYQDADNFDLKYAQWSGSDWIIESVDTAGPVGFYTSLGLTSAGMPVITYSAYSADYATGYLKYAEKTVSGWIFDTIDSCMNYEYFFDNSLALTITDTPYVSYCQNKFASVDLKYACWSAGDWVIETVDNAAGLQGPYAALALDQNQTPHISYRASNGYLKYASRIGPANWQIETVEAGSNTGWGTSLAFDDLDYPHIAYADSVSILKHAGWTGSTWQKTVVDTTGGGGSVVGANASLGFDSDDEPHVGYVAFVGSVKELRYAYWAAGSVEENANNVMNNRHILLQNQPNPLRQSSVIGYQLVEAGKVVLKIYDVTGKYVSTLIDEYEPAGFHTVAWYGKTDKGESVANGIYFYELQSIGFSTTRKMIVLK